MPRCRDVPLGASWLPPATAARLLEAMARGEWFHNNVQCNLALRHDECFHAVPGSNARHFTEEEATHFDAAIAQGHNQIEPDAVLAGGMSVTLEPGQMILQNNVLIHRGWGGLVQGPDGGVVRSVSAAVSLSVCLCLSVCISVCISVSLSLSLCLSATLSLGPAVTLPPCRRTAGLCTSASTPPIDLLHGTSAAASQTPSTPCPQPSREEWPPSCAPTSTGARYDAAET